MKSRQPFYANTIRATLVLTLLLTFFAMPTQQARAAGVLYVKPTATGIGDCSSWANACALQTALINTSSTKPEVWVMQGVYTPGTQRTDTFTLNSIEVYGGFDGAETTRSERDWENNLTTLSGDIGTPNDISDNSYTVVTMNQLSHGPLLDGFTVSGGNSSGAGWYQILGGGMHNHSMSSIVRNVIFSNNSADSGGGMFANGASTLINVTFSNNSADRNGGGMLTTGNGTTTPSITLINVTFNNNNSTLAGGGMFIHANSPTLENVTFNGNTTTGNGGGLYAQHHTSIILKDVTFSNNSADRNGGGMLCDSNRHFPSDPYECNPTLTNVTFVGNAAGADGGGMANGGHSNPTMEKVSFINNSATNGGGMLGVLGTYTLVDLSFKDNSATGDGGGMWAVGFINGILTNLTFSNNSAGDWGGGLYMELGNSTLENLTFSNNSAYSGGGMINYASNTIIKNATFSGNHTDHWGGGMYNHISATSRVENTIFWGNTAVDSGAEIHNHSATNQIIDSVVEGICPTGSTCTNTLNTDPNLSPLADNGGYTETMALGAGSSAIDTGGAITTCTSTDQRSVTRPQGVGCDIGAYELDSTIPTVASNNLVASYTAGPASFMVTFSENVANPTGDTDTNDVTNPANYLLLEEGITADFQTTACNNTDMVYDTQITVDSVSYNAATFTATVNFNNGTPLPDGNYQLFVCGTTSITDIVGNHLNNGVDSSYNFTVQPATATSLPATGFRHGRISALPKQPTAKAYTETAMLLEIPKLGVSMLIVGVPQSDSGWDATWLGNSAGYLAGSAFPTWAGNTVITAHVWDAYNNPGIFSDLKTLGYGDQVQIQAWGLTYTYEVRESNLVTKKNVSTVLQSEEYDWVTLVTCEFYNPFTGDYLFRRAVRAVLVSVK